jgi:hypothetical protein
MPPRRVPAPPTRPSRPPHNRRRVRRRTGPVRRPGAGVARPRRAIRPLADRARFDSSPTSPSTRARRGRRLPSLTSAPPHLLSARHDAGRGAAFASTGVAAVPGGALAAWSRVAGADALARRTPGCSRRPDRPVRRARRTPLALGRGAHTRGPRDACARTAPAAPRRVSAARRHHRAAVRGCGGRRDRVGADRRLVRCAGPAQPSPVVLNRAVAVGLADGARAALELLEPLLRDAALERYQPLHAARADCLPVPTGNVR